MSHYAVLDLEMCRVPRKSKQEKKGLRSELIQIGAVLLNEKYEKVDKFMTFVSSEYGRVDSFIEELTGISNDDIAGAPKFEEAVNAFFDWLPEDSFLVTWSECDKAQIEYEANFKEADIPKLNRFSERWIDCQKTFAEKVNNQRNYKLSEALILADIESVIGEHDALIDAENTALLFAKMEKEEVMTFNKYYSTAEDIKQATYVPFAALLSAFC